MADGMDGAVKARLEKEEERVEEQIKHEGKKVEPAGGVGGL